MPPAQLKKAPSFLGCLGCSLPPSLDCPRHARLVTIHTGQDLLTTLPPSIQRPSVLVWVCETWIIFGSTFLAASYIPNVSPPPPPPPVFTVVWSPGQLCMELCRINRRYYCAVHIPICCLPTVTLQAPYVEEN